MSEYLWIYFVVTIPLTLLIVGSWYYLDRRRERQYAEEDIQIEQGIDNLEQEILAVMRKKTMNKASTWNSNGNAHFRLIGGHSGTSPDAHTPINGIDGASAPNGMAAGGLASSFKGVKIG